MKPTKIEIDIAMNIMDALMAEDFRDEIQGNNWSDDNEGLLREMGIDLYYGCTKICLVCEDLENWVIKVSFDVSDRKSYRDKGLVMDFCAREAENYQIACKKGLGHFFAETYKVGSIHGVDIYLQEKAEVDSYRFEGYFDDYCEENDIEYIDLEDENRLEAVFGNYTELSTMVELIDFCGDYEINDLHSENYGILPSGRQVIIDFSGYSDVGYSDDEEEDDE